MAGQVRLIAGSDRGDVADPRSGAATGWPTTGPLSTWHWHALQARGLPGRPSRQGVALASDQQVRRPNDALGLTQIVRTGWFREVRVKSLDSHRIRTLLTARAQLVAVKVDVGNQIRGMLKTFGHLVGVARGPAFEARVRELVDGDPVLAGVVGSPSRLAHYPS